MLKANRILVVAPHTDDGELGCGGTIARMVEEGKEVYYLAISPAKESLPKEYEPDTHIKELHNAAKVFGIPENNITVFEYPTRRFNEHRQDILEDLLKIREMIQPDVVLTPSTKDLHQDHQTTTNEVIRAFKKTNSTILGYEEPWNHIIFENSLFVLLQKEHVEKKILALQEYYTQLSRNYINEDVIKGLARTRGVQANSEFAEAFEVIRVVIN